MSTRRAGRATSSARSIRPEFGVERAGLPASVISARICPSPGVSISSASARPAARRSVSGRPAHAAGASGRAATPRPRPGAPACCAAPAAARGEHRAARPVEVAGQHVEHVDEPATRACRTPASSCRCGRRRRPLGAPPARAPSAGSSAAAIPVRRRDGLRRERLRQRLDRSSIPSRSSASRPGAPAPPRTARATSANSSSASVPGRIGWCSSATSAVRLRRGSTTTSLPPRARSARSRPRMSGAVIS